MNNSADDPCAASRAFVAAAAQQLAAARGAFEADPRDESLIESLLAEVRSGHVVSVAARLAEEPLLMAIFFQNVDLLYSDGYGGADAVGAALIEALERLAERPP